MSEKNQTWLIWLGLALLTVLLHIPFLEQPFDNDSGANAYHARLIVRGEPLYGTHHPAHHLPGLYYVYASTFWLLGDALWTIKLVLIPWTIATAYVLHRLGVLLFDKPVGLLAAFFYIILTAHIELFGSSGQTELFANLPRIAAFLVLMQLVLKNRPAWHFALVGLLSAAAILFKVIYLSPLALAGFVLLATLWPARKSAQAWRTMVGRALWIGVGLVLGLLPAALYFYFVDLLPQLLMVFSLGSTYVNVINSIPAIGEHTWLLFLLFPLLGLALNNAALLGGSLAGALLIMVNKTLRKTPALYVVVWYGLAFVEASANRRFFLHYYLLLVPPLTLLAAWFLLKIYRDLKALSYKTGPALILGGLLALILAISIQQNFAYYYHYLQYRLGAVTYQGFLLKGWPEEGPKLVQVQNLADYIAQRTTPADHIYYWSYHVQLYYLADRRAPIEVIWPEYIEAYEGSRQRIFGPTTRYIVVDTDINIPTPAWIYARLDEDYELETTIDGQAIYRRRE